VCAWNGLLMGGGEEHEGEEHEGEEQVKSTKVKSTKVKSMKVKSMVMSPGQDLSAPGLACRDAKHSKAKHSSA